MTTATIAAHDMSDEALTLALHTTEEIVAGRMPAGSFDVSDVITSHRALAAEAARRRRQPIVKEITVTEPQDRATSHITCTHPRTKVARAACRRARARAAEPQAPAYSLIKTEAQLAEARSKIAAKGCQGEVKSGARKGQRCGRPTAQGQIVCSGHARSFKI